MANDIRNGPPSLESQQIEARRILEWTGKSAPDFQLTPPELEDDAFELAHNAIDELAELACIAVGQRDRFRQALEEIAKAGDTLSIAIARKALGLK